MVFAPHPDDETFGMGGTILRLTGNRQLVNVVILTDGGLGGDKKRRNKETLAAIKLLDVQECYFLKAPDRGLEVNVEYNNKIIDLIEEYRPDNIFFTSPLEYHPDHRTTAWLVWNALQSINFKGNAFSYEVGNQSPANTLMNISSVMNKKIEVMKCYSTQLLENDYIEKIKAINSSRTYTLSKDIHYAEAFFHFNDLSSDLMSGFINQYSQYHIGLQSNKLPLVSILIRTKNRPELLKNALASIKNQTYQNFEVNIINDGVCSIKNIVDEFEFKRVHIKNHRQSKGRAKSANALLKMSNGEYCIFLDDDDTFDYEHIENLINICRENKSILVCYSSIRVGNNLEDTQPFNQPYNAALLRHSNYIPFHAVLFSRKLIELGCKFDNSFEIYEDWDFWLQLAQHTNFYHLDKISATYNINGDSGASGDLNKRDDQAICVSRIYEKWSKIWSGSQLRETFEILSKNSTGHEHNITAQENLLQHESKIPANNDEDDISFKEQNDYPKHINNKSDNNIELLFNKQIENADIYSTTERSFIIRSCQHYEAQCIDLYKEVFKAPITPEFWKWKYINVQWRGICAIKKDKVIAHYNGVPRDILLFGERKKAIQSCDTMVSSLERGGFKKNSPFYNIAKIWIMVNLGLKKEFLLSYGFPNKNTMALGESLGLYVEVDKILQITWQVVDIVEDNPFLVEELNIDTIDTNSINTLWNDMAVDFKDSLLVIRDADYLISRYLEHPAFKYKLYSIKNNDNDMLAVFVLKQKNDQQMLLVDIIAKKENFKLVVNNACYQTKKSGFNVLNFWVTSSKLDLFKEANGLIKDVEISIPGSAITQDVDPGIIKNKWLLMYGDTDFI
ncbi:MAG: PIG-L family deacetylase [gamma proteobacterium symbiont of Taylorina sp.]|nr:PIG-L family deacetylase [gamma proteobacterium symbiont of Taylorina sp.]